MNSKRTFYCELAYIIGIVILAFSTALMEKADFGLSMVVAPAYLIHLKVAETFPFYTFGMSEYIFQAVLLVLLTGVMRKFKISYLFSFVTAILYGLLLDVMMVVVGMFPLGGIVWRFVFFVVGLLTCSLSIALLFHTYVPPEAYEMFVKEFSGKYRLPIAKVKTVYDLTSCAVSIVLSFAFYGFGVFVGIKWGTIVCALINGWIIGKFSDWLDKKYAFKDAFPLRNKLS